MGFLKGIFNFVLMIILSICLLAWFSYGLLNDSVLSYEVNQNMVDETPFTEEVTSEILDRYHTKLSDLSFDEDILLSFVNESGMGVLGYILSEYEEMPNVDVSFLKEYVTNNVTREEASKFYGNVDIDETIQILREVPEGESITKAMDAFLEGSNISIDQKDVDSVTELFLEHKELDDESLKNKIISEIAYEKLNLNEMSTELSLQQLFDRLMAKNPFTVVRELLNVINKNIYGYMVLMMVIVFLLIFVSEFKITSTSTWLTLSLVLAILPLQLIRLLNFVVDRDYFTVFNGMESYKNYMLDSAIAKLNTYSIAVLVVVIALFILGKVLRHQGNDKVDQVEDKKKSRFVLVRVAIVGVLLFGLYINAKACYNYNRNVYDEIEAIKPSDFDPKSMDETLSGLLNINYDF
ncbi:MAG: hypothetical protein JEZ08_10065 [Clostridiales bacterium]|nr:hypothetical protein [Clostridiales bacterium]